MTRTLRDVPEEAAACSARNLYPMKNVNQFRLPQGFLRSAVV